MKIVKDFLIALSLANLFLMNYWTGIFLRDQDIYFSSTIKPLSLYAVLSTILFLGGIALLIIRIADRTSSKAVRNLCYLTLIATLWIPLHHIQVLSGISIRYPFLSASRFLGDWGMVGTRIKIGLIGLVCLALYFRQASRFIFSFRVLLLPFSMAAILAIGKMGYYAVQDKDVAWPKRQVSASTSPQPKILWMLFDEMDEHYSTTGLPPGVSLPEFDRLRKESFSATRVSPPSGRTILSIPSYFNGKLVTGAIPSGRQDLSLSFCGETKSVPWKGSNHLMKSAYERGLSTSLVGWYHPYCRVMEGNVDNCISYPIAETPYQSTYLASVGDVISDSLHPYNVLNLHQRRFHRIQESVNQLMKVGFGEFSFIHWPLPHLPGILSTSEQTFHFPSNEWAEGYFNNLVVADRAFGAARSLLEASGDWERTIVVVTSDHGFRLAYPKGLPWESKPPGQQRIPFLIKFPGKPEQVKYQKVFNAVLIHDMLLDIMDGKVKRATDLTRWLDARSSDFAFRPTYDRPDIPSWKCEVN